MQLFMLLDLFLLIVIYSTLSVKCMHNELRHWTLSNLGRGWSKSPRFSTLQTLAIHILGHHPQSKRSNPLIASSPHVFFFTYVIAAPISIIRCSLFVYMHHLSLHYFDLLSSYRTVDFILHIFPSLIALIMNIVNIYFLCTNLWSYGCYIMFVSVMTTNQPKSNPKFQQHGTLTH